MDIATKTGYAALASSGEVLSGVIDFAAGIRNPSRNRGRVIAAARVELQRLVDELRPTAVLYERPFVRGAGTRLLFALAGVAELVAAEAGLDAQKVSAATVRRQLCGRGDARKPQVQAALRARGVGFETDDEADALAILHAVLDRDERRRARPD